MAKNLKLIIAYVGTPFYGWQATGNYPSIQCSLKNVLEKVLQEKIDVEAASRTDRGVHAEGQVVHFITQKASIDINRLQYALNCLLPKEIVVVSVEEAPMNFHATIHAKGKEYHYTICNQLTQSPKQRDFTWHYPLPLDLLYLKKGAEILTGTHDFKAFCNMRKNLVYESTVREIKFIQVVEKNKNLIISIRGRNFLYKMVRNIVGTLVYLGARKLTLDDVAELLVSKKRIDAGLTAPAQGLTLMKIFYSEEEYNHCLFD